MNQVLQLISRRRVDIRHQILALEAELDELDAGERVLHRFVQPSGEDVEREELGHASPPAQNGAGGFDSLSLTEIAVKPRVQVPPGVVDDDAKGGSTGMERSGLSSSSVATGQSPGANTSSDAGEGETSSAPIQETAEHCLLAPPAGEEVDAASPALSSDGRVNGGGSDEVAPRAGEEPRDATLASSAPSVDERAILTSKGWVPVRRSREEVRHLVSDVLAEHPHWAVMTVARQINAEPDDVRAAMAHWDSMKVKPRPSVPEPKITLQEQVRLLHVQHPDWTAGLISKSLGASYNSVSTYLAWARKQDVAA